MEIANRVAVITGAGSGIGRGIALAIARRGGRLALCDVREDGLTETAALVGALGAHCTTHRLDVADRHAVAAFPAEVLAAHGKVHLLFNNAGVAVGGTFERVSEQDFDWLMEINFHAVVRMTRAFLPHLHAADRGWITNISSLYGLVAPPGQTAYCASKFAVRGFSNSLRHELRGSNVGMTVVHPGGVATGIVRHSRLPAGTDPAEAAQRIRHSERLLRMPPEKAGEIIVRGVERGRARVLVGADAKLLAVLERLMPVRYWSVLQALVFPG